MLCNSKTVEFGLHRSLDCGEGVIACTGDFKGKNASPICEAVPYVGRAYPRVYCKWYEA